MADTRIINLPTSIGIDSQTYMVGDNPDSEGTVKFTYAQLGKVLLETYNGTTLGSVNQSVKSALQEIALTDSQLTQIERILGIN